MWGRDFLQPSCNAGVCGKVGHCFPGDSNTGGLAQPQLAAGLRQITCFQRFPQKGKPPLVLNALSPAVGPALQRGLKLVAGPQCSQPYPSPPPPLLCSQRCCWLNHRSLRQADGHPGRVSIPQLGGPCACKLSPTSGAIFQVAIFHQFCTSQKHPCSPKGHQRLQEHGQRPHAWGTLWQREAEGPGVMLRPRVHEEALFLATLATVPGHHPSLQASRTDGPRWALLSHRYQLCHPMR